MKEKQIRNIVYAGVIAALYVVLTHLQNLIFPDSAEFAVQFRASEALCVLAFFTPTAIPGLTLGCLVFNLTYAQALPLDFLIGSIASLLATACMWMTRNIKVKKLPLLGMAMPALWNALLVGGELTVYIGGGFFLNAVLVAVGEAAVLYVLGTILYLALTARRLDQRLFA